MSNNSFTFELADALRGAISGDNGKLLILNQMKQDMIQFCQSMIEIAKSDFSLRYNALVQLKHFIEQNCTNFSPDFIRFLCQEYIILYNLVIDQTQLRIMVPTFITLFKIAGTNWENFPLIFNLEDPKKLPFQIELLNELLLKLKENAEFIIGNLGVFINLSLVGLQQDDWDLKLKSIKITSFLATFDPEAVSPQLNLIFALIQQSPSLSETMFLSLWIEVNSLITIIELSPDQCQLIFQSAVQSLHSDQLSSESKIEALTAMSILPINNDENTVELLNQAFFLSIVKVQSNEFLDSAKDIYLKEIDTHEPQFIYDFIKNKINEALSSGGDVPNVVTVSFYLIKDIIDKIENQVKNDWAFFSNLIETASKSDQAANTLLFESFLMFIASLNSSFEIQLLQSHLFADIIIPLIVSPISSIRHHARDAVYTAIESVSVPVPEIVDKIWFVQPGVNADEGEYLTLLAKAIELEGDHFETEKAIGLTDFLISCFKSENDQMIIGALSVATILIMENEAVHEILLMPTIATIQNSLMSENPEVQANALNRMTDLFPLFKDRFSPESQQKVEEMIHDQNPLVIKHASNCFLTIAKEMDQKGVIDSILPIFQSWICTESKSYFNLAVTAVQSLAPILGPKVFEILSNIFNVAVKSSDEDHVSDCFDAVAAILSKTFDEGIKPRVVEMVASFATSFFQGKFAINNETEPINSDLDIETMNSFSGLLCELLHFHSEINPMIFHFIEQLIASENIDYIDLSLSMMGDGILYGGFSQPKEIAFIISYIQSVSTPETDINLIQSIAYVLICLLDKNLLTEQALQPLFALICKWWENIYNAMKEIMIETLTNLSIIIWSIALKYGNLNPDIFAQTFELFPPKDINDTLKMCDMLIGIANNNQLRNAFLIPISISFSKLLVLPKMMLMKKKIPNELIANFGRIFSDLFKSNADVQAAVMQRIQGSQILKNRLLNFIQP